jgi:hypothetical protein
VVHCFRKQLTSAGKKLPNGSKQFRVRLLPSIPSPLLLQSHPNDRVAISPLLMMQQFWLQIFTPNGLIVVRHISTVVRVIVDSLDAKNPSIF